MVVSVGSVISVVVVRWRLPQVEKMRSTSLVVVAGIHKSHGIRLWLLNEGSANYC